jgi:hypothetical protein
MPTKHLELYPNTTLEAISDPIVLGKEYERRESKTKQLMKRLYNQKYSIRRISSSFRSIDLSHLPASLEVYINRREFVPDTMLPKSLKYLEWRILAFDRSPTYLGLEFKDSIPEESIGSLKLLSKSLSGKSIKRIPSNTVKALISNVNKDIEPPDGLRSLYITREVKKLPESLEELVLDYYSCKSIPDIPRNLKRLCIKANINHIKASRTEPIAFFPESLEELSLEFSGEGKIGYIGKFPSRLRKLHIQCDSHAMPICLASLPDSIQDLSLLGSIQLPDILPSKLRILNVDKVVWPTLPSSLKELYVQGISRIYSLPAGLRKLEALHSTLAYSELPSSLESLSIYSIQCKLPEGLRALSIMVHYGTIELPEKLETLRIYLGSFEILEFPRNLRELYLAGDGEKRIGKLPLYLERLTIMHYAEEIEYPERIQSISVQTVPMDRDTGRKRYPSNMEIVQI